LFVISLYSIDELVRVGREPPLDHDICECYLESRIMQRLVDMMNAGLNACANCVVNFTEDILKTAKVIVSTLNYSANNTLISIKKNHNFKFIIVDEGSD